MPMEGELLALRFRGQHPVPTSVGEFLVFRQCMQAF